jgi:serine/threonine protein phosphatase 1
MKEDEKQNRPEGRLFAIGDIHGCSTALRTLIEAIDPRPEDTIVTLGDYIDWGPDSRGVIELLIDLSNRCNLVPLLGNHEEMLLAVLESGSELRYWLKFGGEETLNSYQYNGGRDMIPEDHVRFIRGCRDFYETPTHIFVHANYDPRLPMDRIGSTKLRWEHLDPKDQQPHYSGKMVVVGHTPQVSREVLDLGFLVCIDTDCSRGGWLTGLDVVSYRIDQANQRGEVRGAGDSYPPMDRLPK